MQRRFTVLACLMAVMGGNRCVAQGYQARARLTPQAGLGLVAVDAQCLFDASQARINVGNGREIIAVVDYHPEDGTIVVVDHPSRTQYRIASRLVGAAADAFSVVKGKVDQLRKKPEPMALQIKRTGRRRQLSGVPCHEFDVRDGTRLVQRIWMTSWGNAGITKDDMSVVRECLAMYGKTSGAFVKLGLILPGMDFSSEPVLRLDGYPVEVQHYAGGKVAYTVQLGLPEPARRTIQALWIPEDYRTIGR